MILEKLNANPWRFAVGDAVYIAGWPQDSALITAAFGRGRAGWPHYSVVDHKGAEWVVPQQCLSSVPITS